MRKTIAFVVFLFVFNPVLFGQTVKPDEKIISFRATDMALKDALNLLALKTDVNI